MDSFYSPTQIPLHMCMCIPPCPLSHSQGQDESSWHRGRGAPSTKATAQMLWGIPYLGKSRKRTKRVYHTRAPPQGEGIRRAGECPHATAPVLKYKARGVKRTIPWKYSTNLSTEAKGQWARPLPSEGGRLNESTDG